MDFSKNALNFITKKRINRFSYLYLFLLWAVLVGALIGKEDSVRWSLVIVTSFAPILFLSNALSLAGVIFFIFIVKGVFEPILGILPRQAIWTSDAIIVFLFLKSLHLGVGQKKFEKTPLVLPILLFFIWAVLSGFLSGIPWFTIGVALKDFFRYILLFYAIINLDIEEKNLKSLITMFIVLIFLQVPVTIFQYKLYGQHDWVSGTLGKQGTGEMLILITAIISVLVGFFLYYKSRFKYLWGIPCLLVPLILGSARAALFYIPLTIVFIIRRSLSGKLLMKTFEMFLIVGVLIGFGLMIPFLREPFSSLVTDTIQGLKKQVNAAVIGPEVPGRLRAPQTAVEWINREPLGPVIGYGFGSTKESYFEQYTGRFYEAYSPRTNQLSSTLIEMGYPGLLFYFWLIFGAFAMNAHFFRNTKDKYWKAISFGVDGIIFMHLVGILYHNVWCTGYSAFPFWFFLALIYSVGKQNEIFTKGGVSGSSESS
jgi:hypothetical protein